MPEIEVLLPVPNPSGEGENPELPEVPDGDEGNGTTGVVEMPTVSEDFYEVVARSQALTVDGLGKGFANTQTRQSIIADRKFDELDVEQSFANRYAMTGNPASGQ